MDSEFLVFVYSSNRPFWSFPLIKVNVYSSIASSSYAIRVINLCSYYNNMVSCPNPTNKTKKSVIVVMSRLATTLIVCIKECISVYWTNCIFKIQNIYIYILQLWGWHQRQLDNQNKKLLLSSKNKLKLKC